MKIKVMEIIGSLQTGGAEKQVVSLLNGLDSERFQKHIVCFKNSDTPFGKMLGDDVIRHYVHLARRGQIGCVRRLAALFRKVRPHVVQSHMFHTNLYAVVAAKLAGVPVTITTEHGKNLWKNSFHHLIERHIISPFSTLRVAVSQDIRNIRIRARDVEAEKIVVVPPCVEIPAEAVRCRQKLPLRFGAIGRMVDAKDYPTLIRAYAKFMESGTKSELVFLGDGPERLRLERMAAELGVGQSVQFPGFQTDVNGWLKSMDIVVFSSIREGIPVAMLEAMAVGVPVVATRVGGIPEVIRDGVDGMLVESGNSDEIARALTRLAIDIDLRSAIAKQGRARVGALYSCKVISGRYADMFAELVFQGM